MKNINIVLLALAAMLAFSCQRDTIKYDGKDIVYFDSSAELSEEVAEANKAVSFRITSPLAVGYDRQYNITTAFGGSLVEGENYSIATKVITIKANQYWADGTVDFKPETLRPNVDSVLLQIKPSAGAGEVAAFDNKMVMYVSQRCEVIPSEMAGKYLYYTTMPGNYGAEAQREVIVAKDPEGNIIENTIRVKGWFGDGDVDIFLDKSNVNKGVIPVVYFQQSRPIQIQTEAVLPGYVCTPDQHAYPNLPVSENKSTMKTCTQVLSIYLTWGVRQDQEDGSVKEGHLEGTPCLEKLTRLDENGKPLSTIYGRGDNMDCRIKIQ